MFSIFKQYTQKFCNLFLNETSRKPPRKLYFQNPKIKSYSNLNIKPELYKQFKENAQIQKYEYKATQPTSVFQDYPYQQQQRQYIAVKVKKTDFEFEKEFSGGLKDLLIQKPVQQVERPHEGDLKQQIKSKKYNIQKVHVMDIIDKVQENNQIQNSQNLNQSYKKDQFQKQQINSFDNQQQQYQQKQEYQQFQNQQQHQQHQKVNFINEQQINDSVQSQSIYSSNNKSNETSENNKSYTHSQYLQFSRKPSFITSSEQEYLEEIDSFEQSEYYQDSQISLSMEDISQGGVFWKQANIKPHF